MCALQIFSCDTTAVERWSSAKQGLPGHYHSTPVTLIYWWTSSLHPTPPRHPLPFSISTYPCLHQFPLTAWCCLSREQTRTEKGRQPETGRWRKKQRMTRIRRKQTDIDRVVEVEREREEEKGVVFLSHLSSFVITCPLAMLIIAKCLCFANNQWKYVWGLYTAHLVSLPHCSFITLQALHFSYDL